MADEHGIRDRPGPWHVRHVAETGSTNADLLAAAEAGEAAHLSVLVADHQSAGRGRLDRRWSAPPGTNLLVSLLFTEVPDEPGRLTQLVGVAALEAIDRLTAPGRGATIGLKWPNDVLLDGRKLAGILAQRSPSSGAVVVGLGLNVRWAPTGAASLRDDLGFEGSPGDVLDSLLDAIELSWLEPAGRAVLAERYRKRLLTIGQAVRVELPGDVHLLGVATDVDSAGRLIVAGDEGTRHVLDVGDVVHLRSAAGGPVEGHTA